jgi:hypothetical protein
VPNMGRPSVKWLWRRTSDVSVVAWLWSLLPATGTAAVIAFLTDQAEMPLWAIVLLAICGFLLAAYLWIYTSKAIAFCTHRRAWAGREFISIGEAGHLVSRWSGMSSTALRSRLGSGLIGHNQKHTVAAMVMADMKACAHRS